MSRDQDPGRTIIEWTPTMILQRDPWNKLTQLWVRVRRVESTDADDGMVMQREVADHEWRHVP